MLETSPEKIIAFELLSSPGAFCICNATWNNFEPPVPHPERAPIVDFLRNLFGLRYVDSAAVFYGPSGIADPNRVREWEEIAEPVEQFVEHFFTEEPGKTIGTGASGFFLVRDVGAAS
jgi:hypothetical protein